MVGICAEMGLITLNNIQLNLDFWYLVVMSELLNAYLNKKLVCELLPRATDHFEHYRIELGPIVLQEPISDSEVSFKYILEIETCE